MLTKRIIACMDIADGRVVKGTNYTVLKNAGDPIKLGKLYNKLGIDELVFLDIKATIENRKNRLDLVKKIAEEINIPFSVGGGIKTVDDIRDVLKAGADKVSIGSAAINNPRLIEQGSKLFGSQCIVISLDPKKKSDGSWELYIRGGSQATGIDAVEFAKKMEILGAGELLTNSMDRDGTKFGYDVDLLCALNEAVNLPIIASSGAGKKEDFLEAFTNGKADAALAATLFHYRQLEVRDLKRYLNKNNIPVNL